MSPLELKQIFFLTCVARFITDAAKLGYQATVGEAWRSPETCALYAQEGKGILHSLHPDRLAIDLNFFYEGALITTPPQIAQLWESYTEGDYKCTAGLFFITRIDADHFSVENDGVQ